MALFLPSDTALRERASHRYREFSASSSRALPILLGPGRVRQVRNVFSYQLDDATVNLGHADAEFVGVRHEYALDSLIRILLTAVLLPQKGFLLHAASVVRDGRAYVFAGRSGAGKSTVASLSPEGSVLTDEISLLRYSEGQWYAHGTPFWGEFRAAGRNERYPLGGIYLLKQAGHDSVEMLSMKGMLLELLPCVLFFTKEPHANQAMLTLLSDFVAQMPVQRLFFRRHPEFWKAVAA